MSNGREVDGLGITAQQKGAKAVLASLWSVADESTAQFMTDFYRQWLGTPGTTKAGALQKAQLDMLHGAAYTHPFYWSPFVLIGNWK